MNRVQVISNFLSLSEFLQLTLEGSVNTNKKIERQAFVYKFSTVIIAASITLVLGLNIDKYSNVIALVLSSILTVLTTMDQFQRFTTRHIGSNKRQVELVKLSFDFNFYLKENKEPTEEKFMEFKDKFLSIIEMEVNELASTESSIKENIQALGKKV